MLSGKKTQGRRMVELTRMSNKSNMQVTFSKRRSGLFKKASELSTLCGADLVVVVFSPGEKVYSFGHPNIDTVIDRYLSGVPHQNYGTLHSIAAQRRANIIELNSRLNEINIMMEAEKMTKDKLSQIRNTTEAWYWWARPFDGMNLDELEFLKKINEDLKSLIAQSANRHVIQGDPTQTLPYFGGNGSTSTMPDHHQPNPQAASQMFMEQPIQNPMVQPYFLGFNNMGGGGGGGGGGGEGGYGPSGSFF